MADDPLQHDKERAAVSIEESDEAEQERGQDAVDGVCF